MPPWPRLLPLALLAAIGRAHAEPAAPPQPDPASQCQAAILAAEREHRLPPALMGAIALVESGRPREDGSVTPWPWTINVQGQGRFFETKAEAVAAVRALQARGIRVIDVGCMQVNLHHHPQAFANLEEAFDPLANARYAGLFLTRLRAATRDWVQASGQYHSQTPELAEAYRLRVLAAWPGMTRRLAEERRRMAEMQRRQEEAQRRQEVVDAWAAATSGRAPNGFQAVALARAMAPPPSAAPEGGARRAVASRHPSNRRASLVEVAEAPRR